MDVFHEKLKDCWKTNNFTKLREEEKRLALIIMCKNYLDQRYHRGGDDELRTIGILFSDLCRDLRGRPFMKKENMMRYIFLREDDYPVLYDCLNEISEHPDVYNDRIDCDNKFGMLSDIATFKDWYAGST